MRHKKNGSLSTVSLSDAAGGDSQSVVAEPELLTESLAYLLKRAVVRCDTVLIRELQGEISPARLSALACVEANPGMTQSALGSLLGIAGPSVFKVVDDLVQFGLLRRAAGSDRRSSALYLTDIGLERLERYRDALYRTETKISKQLTQQERGQLRNLLGKLGPSGSES